MRKRDFYVSKLGMPILVTGSIDTINTPEGALKIGIHKVEPKGIINEYDYEWEMVELTTGLKLCNFKVMDKCKVPVTTEFINKAIKAVSTKKDTADRFKKDIVRLYNELPEYLY